MTTSDELYLTRLDELLRRKESKLALVRQEFDRAKGALDRIDTQMRKLKGMKADPVVLVRRSPGPKVEIYHSCEDPCGRVTRGYSGNFRQVFLREARRKGLRPCSACAYGVERAEPGRRT